MRTALAYLGAVVAAVAVVAALDAAGVLVQARLFRHAAENAIATALGALQGLAWHRFLRGRTRARAGFVGAVAAGVTSFLLARSTLPWLDLGGIGAGPLGELPLFVLPVASVIAVATARRLR